MSKDRCHVVAGKMFAHLGVTPSCVPHLCVDAVLAVLERRNGTTLVYMRNIECVECPLPIGEVLRILAFAERGLVMDLEEIGRLVMYNLQASEKLPMNLWVRHEEVVAILKEGTVVLRSGQHILREAAAYRYNDRQPI